MSVPDSATLQDQQSLDHYLSPAIRTTLEARYYEPVNARSSFEVLSRDPEFMGQLHNHVGLFSDHGVVHVRDVAQQTVTVLLRAHGILLSPRPAQRLALMQGYGVLLAYLHDIGMSDFSTMGRAIHPEFAAQAVYDPALADVIDEIWFENSGNVAWHLSLLVAQGVLQANPQLVLREMLALSVAHSKSKVPMAVLNDLPRLRQLMIATLTTDLSYLYLTQQVAELRQATTPAGESPIAAAPLAEAEAALAAYCRSHPTPASRTNPHLAAYYTDVAREAYQWLLTEAPAGQALVADVIDTVRALRCADALRQRGTMLKTSGGYDVFVDRHSANAIYALRLGDDQLFLLELDEKISAGEANIASSELDPAGDLRISFHRGAFTGPGAVDHAVECAAAVILDIQQDVIGSFERPAVAGQAAGGLKQAADMCILLEECGDNPQFAIQVQQALLRLAPNVGQRVHVVPSLKNTSDLERRLYLAAEPLDWSLSMRQDLLWRVGQTGQVVDGLDQEAAFQHVRLVSLAAGDTLIQAATPADIVYIPLGPGLRILPLGGYQSFMVQPWMPLGNTGVIRGAVRNATVVAERAVQLLAIPKTVYLRHWHATHSRDSLRAAVAERATAPAGAGQLSQLEKVLYLQGVPLFQQLAAEQLAAVAERMVEVHYAAGEVVFAKDTIGRSLYVVLTGRLRVHDGAHTINWLEVGDVFGELAALTPEPRTATVTAATEARLLRLEQAMLHELLDSHPAIARGLIVTLAGYVRHWAAEVAELRANLAG